MQNSIIRKPWLQYKLWPLSGIGNPESPPALTHPFEPIQMSVSYQDYFMDKVQVSSPAMKTGATYSDNLFLPFCIRCAKCYPLFFPQSLCSKKPRNFEVKSSEGLVATVKLVRAAYKLGDPIDITVAFGDVQCVQVDILNRFKKLYWK